MKKYTYDELPLKIKDLIETLETIDETYETCRYIQTALNQVGWDCDYGLDAVITEFWEVDNPFEWWDLLNKATKLNLMSRYCDHWTDTGDVTDNDIIVMFEGENPREKELITTLKTDNKKPLMTEYWELKTENQQLREALNTILTNPSHLFSPQSPREALIKDFIQLQLSKISGK